MNKIKRLIVLSFIVSIVSTLIAFSSAYAAVVFFADFEGASAKALPNKDVNDPKNWKPTNAGTIWAIGEFPNGTKGLKQTAEGCGVSGNTPLPVPAADMAKWGADFTFEMEFAQGDDDSFAIHFRQTAPDKGYALLLGTVETPRVILADLAKGCSKDAQCWSDNCENKDFIKDKAHGLAFDINAGKTGKGKFYKAKLEVKGDKIKLWYGEPGKEALLIDVADSTYKTGGSIGIFHESNSNSLIDNVKVDSLSLAVDPHAKMATSWGEIKRKY